MNSLLKHKLSIVVLALVMSFGLATVGTSVATVIGPAPPVYAADKCGPNEQELKIERNNWKDAKTCCPKGTASSSTSCLFGKYVNPLLSLMSALVGIAVVGGIIFGGITYSSSGGDPQKIAKGKDYIRNALIVLVAYLLMYGFLQFLIPGGKFHA